MLSISGHASIGKPLSEVLALRDQDGNDWHATNRPYDGLRTRVAIPEQSWILPSGTRSSSRPGLPGPGSANPSTGWSSCSAPDAAGPASTASGPTWSPPSPTSSDPR